MNNNLLPIGTVVKTYKSDKQYIIMGTFFKKGAEQFTYYCCLYPYGFLLDFENMEERVPDYEIFINQNSVKEIIFLGNVN